MATSPVATQARAGAQIGIRGLWWKCATGILMALAIPVGLAYVGPSSGFTMQGHGAKIIFFHVPCAWLACLSYVVAAWYAVRFLSGVRAKGFRAMLQDDLKSAVAMELGLVFSVLATVTGMIFSRNEWGLYWHWDPRQTSILVVMLLFAAYVALRGAVTEPERRGRLSAVYALVALIPGLFLIWVLPRIVDPTATTHGEANKAVVGGGIGGNYRVVLYGLALPAFLGLFTWMFQLGLRFKKLVERG